MRPAFCRISSLSWVVIVDRAELTTPTGLLLETGGVKVMEGMGLEGPATRVVVMARVVLLVLLRGLTRCVGALVVVVMAVVMVIMAVVVVVTGGCCGGGAFCGGAAGGALPKEGVVAASGRWMGWSMAQVVKERSPEGRGEGRGKGFLGRLAKAWAKFSLMSGIKCTRSLSHLL